MTHTFTPNAQLLNYTNDILNSLELDPYATQGIYAPKLWVDQVAPRKTESARVPQRLHYGSLRIIIKRTARGRSTLNQIVRILKESGAPVPFVFTDSPTTCDALSLYTNFDPKYNGHAQLSEIGFILSGNPVELDQYVGQTQGGRPVLPSSYSTEYGRVHQSETEDDGLNITIPVLLPKASIRAFVTLLAHVADVNAQDDLVHVNWSVCDASLKKAIANVTYDPAHVLYDGAWHDDLFQTLETCAPMRPDVDDSDLPF